ncbi:MAG: nucleoside triphosphate pyrophosphohydrolase [Fibrobacterota bacterium]
MSVSSAGKEGTVLSLEKEITRLTGIMTRLRSPNGCPWDREQTHASLLKCLIEECFEFYEAALEKDAPKMCEELGDLLLQIVFHCQLAREAGQFDLAEVCAVLSDKLTRRHPHVFGETRVHDSDEVVTNWEAIKRKEKGNIGRKSRLDGIPAAMPAMLKALKIQKRAAKAGFDWPEAAPIFDKIAEETAELKAEVAGKDPERMTEELGDLLFSVVNLARRLSVDPEEALYRTNAKFNRRFRDIETALEKEGKRMEDLPLADLDRYWDAAKKRH